MKAFDDHIKSKLSWYHLENYNVENGWHKFQAHHTKPEPSLLRVIAWAAAACLVIIAGVWSIQYSKRVEEKSQASALAARRGPTVPPATFNITAPETIDQREQKQVMANKQKQQKQEQAISKPKPEIVVEQVQEPGFTAHHHDEEKSESEPAIAAPDPVTTEARSLRAHLPQVITVEQLDSMIFLSDEQRPNRGKVMAFIVKKGEQKEYVSPEHSSAHTGSPLINLK